MRTKVQRDADDIDMSLYRLQTRLERFAESLHPKHRQDIYEAIMAVSQARGPIRKHMSEEDRKAAKS